MTPNLANHLTLSGVILCTENYEPCVEFYREKLGLPIWFEKPNLTCLHFGESYLMIEKQGMAKPRKSKAENPITLRLHVKSVDEAAKALKAQNIEFVRKSFEWGEVATFWDPDGNECELKNADDPFFLVSAEKGQL